MGDLEKAMGIFDKVTPFILALQSFLGFLWLLRAQLM